uniref:FTH domain-containing protein n=1 Tax=Steinernema glaseri TaxID=37863 RepID=A0A1I7YDS3_9BILA
MVGFDHIKSRTLSREVIKEMSKSITSIRFYLSYYDVDDDAKSISPDEVELVQLLAHLDAPVKKLKLDFLDVYVPDYEEARLKYLSLFKSFTSLKLEYFSRDTQYMADTISEPMLRSSRISAQSLSGPNNFCVGYSSSDGLTEIAAGFEEFGMALEVIDRWKKMDPRTLPYYKLFCGLKTSSVTRTGEGMQEIDMEAEAALVDKVGSSIGRHKNIESLYLINHPADPNSKIYVVFSDEIDRYGRKDGETDLLFD